MRSTTDRPAEVGERQPPQMVGGDLLRKAVMEASLQAAVNQAADDVNADELDAQGVGKKPAPKQKKGGISPLTGQPTPPGRPKGAQNKTTTTIRDAVMQAFTHVGGWTYLAKLAEGTQSDRAAFVGLLNKVLPTQINANVEGGIKLELSWLGARQIGTTAAQPVEEVTQVIDLERDAKGKYRIADQQHTNIAGGVDGIEAAGGDKDMGK
jgi:hypothetical protein